MGDSKEAAYFSAVCSVLTVVKKMYRGKIAEKSTTGATIAASFELEKNTLMKNENVTSDIQNVKKNAYIMNLLELGKNDDVAIIVIEIATQENNRKATINQLV